MVSLKFYLCVKMFLFSHCEMTHVKFILITFSYHVGFSYHGPRISLSVIGYWSNLVVFTVMERLVILSD